MSDIVDYFANADIVDCLRHWQGYGGGYGGSRDLLREAADEIERLRADRQPKGAEPVEVAAFAAARVSVDLDAHPSPAGGLREALAEMEQRKDAAYLERNRVVAALARLFPSGIARTNIPGWSDDWHGCVYIDLPTGQVSWHYHDSQAFLFEGLPAYSKPWDGHDTEEKYRRLAALSSPAPAIVANQFDEGGEAEQWGMQFALQVFAKQIAGVDDWEGGDGSETVDGDIVAEFHNIARAAGWMDANGDTFLGHHPAPAGDWNADWSVIGPELVEVLKFYRDGFQFVPKRGATGVGNSTWKPKSELLDDCGERARAALSRAQALKERRG